MNIYEIIGENIRGFRNRKNWTQEKLSIRADINTNYLGNIERAEKKVSIDTLLKLGKVLNIEPHIFLIRDAYKKDPV